jgi:hypothetical protein
VLSGLSVGTSAQIVGKTADTGWWYIVDPLNSGRNCWVASSVTNTAGNLANIPVVAAPQASVTNVTVDVDPNSINAPGCLGPILPVEISGTIETNGPGTVIWHFETQQGGAMSTQTTEFDAFGTQDFSVDYTPPITAGTYWVRLVVTESRNSQRDRYTISCPQFGIKDSMKLHWNGATEYQSHFCSWLNLKLFQQTAFTRFASSVLHKGIR